MGHVDHGKTALVGALTGMETDRLPEEKARGVSIVLGFAHARFGAVEVDFIDMPGHERFVRAMVSGATGVAGALLVVAANEGIKPQTVEHLEIAALLGLGRILPVISKADLVTPEEAQAAGAEVAALLADYRLDAAAPVVVSTRSGEGLEALGHALARFALELPAAPDDGFVWLPIDRAFSVAGRGTVVTGTLRRGRLDTGADGLALLPSGAPARIRGLQAHGRDVDHALPGERVAVNLRAVEPGDAPRGSALGAPGALVASERLVVEVEAARSAPPLHTGVRLTLLWGSAETPVRLRLLGARSLEPGARGWAELTAEAHLCLPARERFVLRRPSPPLTVAGGRVVDPASPRLRRVGAPLIARLAQLSSASPEAVVRLELEAAGTRAMPAARLQALSGLGAARFAQALKAEKAWRLAGGLLLAHAPAQALGQAVQETLRREAERQPNGLSPRRLASLIPSAAPAALDAAVSALAGAGRVRVEGGLIRPPRLQADAMALAEADAALAERLKRRLQSAGLNPPDLANLAPTPAAKRALERLVKAGEAVHTFDRVQKRELVFHSDAVAQARATLRPRLSPPGLTVGEAGAALNITRKFSVPLLEYLDTVRFTRREGDRRVLGPAGREEG